MQHLRRIRAFLELRQSDIERATGIPVQRLSAAENGKLRLTPPEEKLLLQFLQDRFRVVAELEGWPRTHQMAALFIPEAVDAG